MVRFAPLPLYSWINKLRTYLLEEYLVLRFILGATEMKESRYLSGIEPRFVGHPFRTIVTLRALIGECQLTAVSSYRLVLIIFLPRMPSTFFFGLIRTYPI